MLQDRDIVLMLQLRSTECARGKELVRSFHTHSNDSIKQEVLEHVTSVQGRGVLLVLEGYVELTEDQREDGLVPYNEGQSAHHSAQVLLRSYQQHVSVQADRTQPHTTLSPLVLL